MDEAPEEVLSYYRRSKFTIDGASASGHQVGRARRLSPERGDKTGLQPWLRAADLVEQLHIFLDVPIVGQREVVIPYGKLRVVVVAHGRIRGLYAPLQRKRIDSDRARRS